MGLHDGRVEGIAAMFAGGTVDCAADAKISAAVISCPEFVHVRVAINRDYR